MRGAQMHCHKNVFTHEFGKLRVSKRQIFGLLFCAVQNYTKGKQYVSNVGIPILVFKTLPFNSKTHECKLCYGNPIHIFTYKISRILRNIINHVKSICEIRKTSKYAFTFSKLPKMLFYVQFRTCCVSLFCRTQYLSQYFRNVRYQLN